MSVLKLMNLKEKLMIEIDYDEYSDSPREWDNLGTFYTWDDGYDSPDKNEFNNGIEFFEDMLGEKLVSRVHDNNSNTSDFMKEIIPHADKAGYILYPVGKYEHRQVNYSLGCSSGWDSGTVGVIFAKKEKIRHEYGIKNITKDIREKVEKNFAHEVWLYTQYANGEAYGFTVTDLLGNVIDSCSGFYDDMSDKKMALDITSEYADIGNLEDWEEYDEKEFNERFEIKTILVEK